MNGERRIRRVLTVIGLWAAASVNASRAHAQDSPWQAGGGVGVRLPMRATYGAPARTDFNALMWIGIVSPLLQYGGPRIELGFHEVHLPMRADSAVTDVQSVELSMNWMWIAPRHAGVEPYLILGGGAYYNAVLFSAAPAVALPQEARTRPNYMQGGVSGGLGAFFGGEGGPRWFIEARVHRITKGAPNEDARLDRQTAVLPVLNVGVRR